MARFFYFTFPKQKAGDIKSLKLTTIRLVAAVAAIVVLIAPPRRTYAVTVRAPKFARATIPARWGIPRKQKKKVHVGVGARRGAPSGKTTTLQRCVQRRGGKTRSLANRDSRIRPRRRGNPNRRRTATLSECRARCRTRNRSMGRLRQETKQRGAHGDEERSSDVAYRAQIERKRR